MRAHLGACVLLRRDRAWREVAQRSPSQPAGGWARERAGLPTHRVPAMRGVVGPEQLCNIQHSNDLRTAPVGPRTTVSTERSLQGGRGLEEGATLALSRALSLPASSHLPRPGLEPGRASHPGGFGVRSVYPFRHLGEPPAPACRPPRPSGPGAAKGASTDAGKKDPANADPASPVARRSSPRARPVTPRVALAAALAVNRPETPRISRTWAWPEGGPGQRIARSPHGHPGRRNCLRPHSLQP
jgi:hypothetical protein